MDFIEACRRFIGVESTPSHGTAEITRGAAELCRSLGLKAELQIEELNGVEQANIIARPELPRPDHEFMLQTHLDTVDPGPYSFWKKTGANPFNASIHNGVLHGLGAAEVKLDFLCKLRAIHELSSAGRRWKLPPVLVGTFGEESGMPGAIRLLRKKLVKPVMASVGEPTDMRLVCATKGLAHVEITVPFTDDEIRYRREHNISESASSQSRIFNGKSAHSSTPQLGDSAITKMLHYLSQLPNGIVLLGADGGVNFNTVPAYAMLEIDTNASLREGMATRINQITRVLDGLEADFTMYADEGFEPPCPTLNIGMIRTFEEHLVLSGNFRWPPSVSLSIYEAWVNRLRSVCQEVGGSFLLREYKYPFGAKIDGELVRGCQEILTAMGLNSSPSKQSICNEANVFSRFGIECVVIGPGESLGNVHTPDEHVRIDQLEAAVVYYKELLRRFCL